METIAAIATAQSPSAIGIVRLSGAETRRVLAALFTPVVKCVGIGIVCALGSEACKDAGSGQLASAVELAGAAAALVCALPLVSALLDTVEGIV